MCALFTCCYVRFRWDSDCVCHVLMAVVVALCSLKASVLNSGDKGCLPFTPKNRKFWVENQMVRTIPFGTFRKKWAVV